MKKYTLLALAAALLAAGCSEKAPVDETAKLNCTHPALAEDVQSGLIKTIKGEGENFVRNDAREFVSGEKLDAAVSGLVVTVNDPRPDTSATGCTAQVSIAIPEATFRLAQTNAPLLQSDDPAAIINRRIQGGTASFQGLALSFPIRYSVSVDGSQQAAFTYNDSSLNDGAHLLATVLLPAGVKDLLKIDGKTVKREDALRRLANAEPETASEPEAKPVKPLENPAPIADVLEKKQEQAAEKPEDKPAPPPAKAETPSAKEAEALSPEEPESRISQGEIDQARRAHASAGQSLKSAWKNIDPAVQQSLVDEQREWESKKNRNCAKAAAKGGSAAESQYLGMQCDTRMTKERIEYLRGYSIQ